MFKEFPSMIIQVFLSFVVREYYVVCVCLSIDHIDKGTCSVA